MRRDLSLRLTLVAVAALATLLEAPVALTTVLTGLALVAVGQRLVGLRRRGGLDALLVGTGGTLIVLMLTGLVLHLIGFRLEPSSWAIALALEAIAGLLAMEYLEPTDDAGRIGGGRISAGRSSAGRIGAVEPRARRGDAGWPRISRDAEPAERRSALIFGGWLIASGLVVALGIGISWRATDQDTVEPVQISLAQLVSGQASATVVVSTQQPTAVLQLRVRTGKGKVRQYVVPAVPADSTTRIPIALPLSGRTVITLANPDQTRPLRTLIVER